MGMKKIVLLISLLCLTFAVDAARFYGSHETHNTEFATAETQLQKAQDADNKMKEKARQANMKQQIDLAKNAVKTGNNLPKAESEMRNLLKDTLNIRNKQIHLLLFETIKKQYAQGNEKLFLKQKYDTASLFLTCQRMFDCLNQLDSVEMLPDADGKVKIKYRRNNAIFLTPFYTNLYNGGIYFFNHQNYKEAYSILSTYLSVPSWKLFSDNVMKCDSLIAIHASYLAFVSAYRQNEYEAALKYSDNAKLYKSRYEQTLQYHAEIYLKQKDRIKYIESLKEGTQLFPQSTYFYPRLVDLYCDESNYDEALKVTDYIAQADSTNLYARLVHQTILLNLKDYSQCIEEGKKLIERDETMSEAYYNTALAYYNQVQNVRSNMSLSLQKRTKQIKDLFSKCRPYMEKYRKLEPSQREKWQPVLYNVYLNLNMGKEFAEIEKL